MTTHGLAALGMIRAGCAALVLSVAVVLSGCSSSAPAPPDAKTLAARISGCTSGASEPPVAYAVAQWTCIMPPAATDPTQTTPVVVTIVTFRSEGAETRWLTAPSNYAGGVYIQGRLWVAEVNGQEPDVQYVRSKLGGREVASPS